MSIEIDDEYKRITAEEFAALDFSRYTLVDLREPDELIVSGIEGAINIPFSKFATGLDDIPKDKPVIVYCRVGDFSEQVAEILADRGYDVTNLEGGYSEYRKLTESAAAEAEASDTASADASGKDPDTSGSSAPAADNGEGDAAFIDAKGLKCPGPIVKVADYLRDKPDGTRIRVEATEDAFFSDIKIWCERTGNALNSIDFTDGVIHADITKSEAVQAAPKSAPEQNDKTFVVFSGDLDKTIAAFIMANGAAAMGRNVTMFFTFWGLNILRKPKKVKVKKAFIEKMFGGMMPRGTRKLGLSRMNMGGMGAKMIRYIMKSKGVSSLEELVESAKAHGVKLVACQMSMDIMGIHKEELIEGVELGGVSTFLGSGENSDMSLFI